MEEEKSLNAEENILGKPERSRLRSVRWSFGLEPALFCLYFSYNLATAVLPNQLLKQACLELGYNSSICSNLNTDNVTKVVEEEVQPHVANINSSILLLNSIVPAFLSLVLGSWIDKHGRKKVLMMSFSGYSSTLGLILLFSYFSDNVTPLTPWFYVIACVPLCLMGGWPTLDLAAGCYITDLSSKEDRTFRLGFITFLNFSSNFLAYFSSSYLLAATNMSIVFIITFSVSLAAFIFAMFVVEESIQVPKEVSAKDQIKDIFSIVLIKEIFVTLFKPRAFRERRMIYFLMSIITLHVFTMHGNGTVNYLFVREKFSWDLGSYTVFDSINTVISVTGLLIGLIFLKRFSVSDSALLILALVSAFLESIFKAFVAQPFQLYLYSVLGMFRLLTCAFRSIISNVIPHDEIGKIYSATTFFQAGCGVIAGPLYTSIYKKTQTTFPSAFYLATATTFLIALVLAFSVRRWNSAREKSTDNSL